MAVEDVVTDPSLQAALTASAEARSQALALLDLISSTSPTTSEAALQISAQQKSLYAQLARLRGLHRSATLSARETKLITAEARAEVDRLHLSLQNLYYEQRHLESEISACRDYQHPYTELPLIPVEEFLEKFPEHKDSDEVALTIARIEHEHKEREQLEQMRQQLLRRKQALISDNRKRKDDLAGLDKMLENFIDAAKPIQKTLERVV